MEESFFKQYGIVPQFMTMGHGTRVTERTVYFYRNIEICHLDVVPDTGKVEYTFISKLGINKQTKSWLMFTFAHTPKYNANIDDVIKAYVVPVYKRKISKHCNLCPGYFWDVHEHNNLELENMFLKVIHYVDLELERDPSRVHGWNLMCRLIKWHRSEISRLKDIDCLRRLNFDSIPFGERFVMENDRGAIAITAEFNPNDHETMVFKTFSLDKETRLNDGYQYFIAKTYRRRLCDNILKLNYAEADAIRCIMATPVDEL